ncbi:MAG: anaerobic ribonucleoside-triphosphate reductase activating protein [Synergistaceae bacterium]|nr:anaerobic ribonucleoside-triphosphate reductase activating protein [Synergistaceae bacterium]
MEETRAGGYLPASFLDWEAHVAAVIFTCGCNFRCPWCHNGELVTAGVGELSVKKIIADIKRRAKFLDGVVVSGGEPTLWPGLRPLLAELKELGLAVKLDTNGTDPEQLRVLIDEGLVEHVAMDIKAPLDAASYARLAAVPVEIAKIRESVRIVKERARSYEFRTTFVPALHRPEDLPAIREQLNDDAHWVVQCFKPTGCLDGRFLGKEAAKSEKIREILPDIKIILPDIKIRG